MRVVGQRSVRGGSSAVSLACIISMCFVQRFLGGLSLCFGLWIILFILYPHPSSPFIFPLINECNRCLVPLPGVGAHGWKARIYQGLACSRRSVSRVRCSDDGERVKSYTEEMRGEWGEFPPFSIFSLVFFPRQFFDRVLPSEYLEPISSKRCSC